MLKIIKNKIRFNHFIPNNQQQQWKSIQKKKLNIYQKISIYQALSKSRLSSLITLTTMASYAIIPITSSSIESSYSFINLISTAIGTFLCSASANTINQILEVPMDKQMSRTKLRPLPRKIISIHHATIFASLTGLTGTILLIKIVNPITGLISFTNLILYSFIYTPLKRISILNTWFGSLIGCLPALMGSTAAGSSLLNPISYLTSSLIFFWQFPHFNSLAYTLRRDYSKAGYQMMSNLNPELNSRVSLRYAILTIPLSSWFIPYFGLTNWYFSFFSLIPNFTLILPAFHFWISTKKKNYFNKNKFLNLFNLKFNSKLEQQIQSKKLFWASLIHLPTLLILMMACRPT